jgi:hypothetical protein
MSVASCDDGKARERASRLQEPNHRHRCCLLRPRRERPRRSAAEQRDELATLHSITASAVARAPRRRVAAH